MDIGFAIVVVIKQEEEISVVPSDVIDFDKKRQDANKEILRILEDQVEKNPQLRFGQLLINLSLDHIKFEEEPWITIQIVRALLSTRSKQEERQ